MYTRHHDVPVYEHRAGQLDAVIYNHVRLALTRLQQPIRLSLPGLRSLDFLLQSDAWIVVDSALNDMPVLAWTDFETKTRNALHTPVKCQIRLYHANAGVILRSSLETMQVLLAKRLKHDELHQIIPFPHRPSSQ